MLVFDWLRNAISLTNTTCLQLAQDLLIGICLKISCRKTLEYLSHKCIEMFGRSVELNIYIMLFRNFCKKFKSRDKISLAFSERNFRHLTCIFCKEPSQHDISVQNLLVKLHSCLPCTPACSSHSHHLTNLFRKSLLFPSCKATDSVKRQQKYIYED